MNSAAKAGEVRGGTGRVRGWRGIALAALGIATLFACSGESEVEPEAQRAGARPGVTHVAIDRALDVGTQALLRRSIAQAVSDGHDTLVIEIDTPGGEVELMSHFSGLIEEASKKDLLTVAWVSGGATSAGALIALSCDRIYMRPSATMGSAAVITLGPQGMAPLPEEGGVREKITSHWRSKFRAVAEANSRPPVLAAAMVDEEIEALQIRHDGELRIVSGDEWDDLQRKRADVQRIDTIVPRGDLLNVTGREAVKYGLADGTAETMGDLFDKIGKSGLAPVTMERKRSEEVLAFLASISSVLLGLGLLLGWMELKQPGFGLPGILAVVCFGVLLTGRYMTGLADVPHLVLVAVGLALVAVELFLFPGTIWIGVVGGILVIGGLLVVEIGPGIHFDNTLDRELAINAALNLAVTASVTLVGAWMISRFLPQMPVLNRIIQSPVIGGFAEALPESHDEHARSAQPGERGMAATALRPVGKVVLDIAPSLEYEARAEGDLIEGGTKIEVVSVVGGRLLVRVASSEAELARNGSHA